MPSSWLRKGAAYPRNLGSVSMGMVVWQVIAVLLFDLSGEEDIEPPIFNY